MRHRTFTLTLMTGLLVCVMPMAVAGAEDRCDGVDDWHSAGPVALGNVQVERGPLDFEGPRVTGCLRNDGDAELFQVMLEFESIREERAGGGGFTRNLRLEGLVPGETTGFATGQSSGDPDRYERFGTVGYRFSGVNVLMDGADGRPEFDAETELELPRMLAERPEHDLEAECAATDPADGEGEIWINSARLETVGMPGSVNVVGCVTNRSDETIADGMRHRISVSYGGEAGDEPERMAMVGGQGHLTVTGPLEPGKSSLFVSSFDFDRDIIDIEVYPAEYDFSGDTAELVERGPRVSLEK